MKILVINGPNLGLLGKREPEIYGSLSLAEIEKVLREEAKKIDKNIDLSFFQSDIEGEIVKKIGDAWTKDGIDAILINPGAYTHTSIAIHDAIKASGLKAVEVHISNIYKREDFRHTSIISSACIGQISGFGVYSYILGLNALLNIL
jgi:3-dehydroquinate dehydratase-2